MTDHEQDITGIERNILRRWEDAGLIGPLVLEPLSEEEVEEERKRYHDALIEEGLADTAA